MFRTLRSLMSRPGKGKRPERPLVRPQLESLEDRRLLSAGSLDPHFGSGGTAIIPFYHPIVLSATF